MKKLRVGIVGCGEAAQILHLPSLYQLCDQFEVTALCDASRTVVDGVGGRWNITERETDYRRLVTRDDVDVVLIANPSPLHFPVTMAAIEAGKHVLVEKPMCYATEEADAIAEAATKAGVTVQVGYMRRYAPAFLEACALVRDMGDVSLARVHDVIGKNAQIIQPTSRVIKGDDIPEDVVREASDRDTRALEAAIGKVAPEVARAYHIMLGLSSHDLSAMREIIGVPRSVLFARQHNGGTCITAAFDYGDFVCQFETGIDRIARFDAHIEVYGAETVVRVQYNTPYVRNLPTVLSVERAKGTHGVTRSTEHDWGDSFVEEWRALYESIDRGNKPKSSPEDFRADLELFAQIVEHMQSKR